MGEHNIFVGKPDHLVGSRNRWKENIEIDLKEVACENVVKMALDILIP
jgi:hypothetical protein